MACTLRKTSWTYLETLFQRASNGTGPIQNKNFKMIENIFWKIFSKISGIWIFSIGISMQILDIFLKSREMLKIIMFFMIFWSKIVREKFSKNVFDHFWNFCFEWGRYRWKRAEKLFLNTSTRSFATYVPYAISIFACRVNSLARFFPTFWGNLTFN